MPIATKNGQPIVASGGIALNCECCQPCPCTNSFDYPRQIHSDFNQGWACVQGHAPPDQIVVEVNFTGERIEAWDIQIGKGPIGAVPVIYQAPTPAQDSQHTLTRVLRGGGYFGTYCAYESQSQIFPSGLRRQGAITVNPGINIGPAWPNGYGWDAVMKASLNPFNFLPHDILGVFKTYGDSIPWDDFDVESRGDDDRPVDCAISLFKDAVLSDGLRYSLLPLPSTEPNAKLENFSWAFCFEAYTTYKFGPDPIAGELRRMKIATIRVI